MIPKDLKFKLCILLRNCEFYNISFFSSNSFRIWAARIRDDFIRFRIHNTERKKSDPPPPPKKMFFTVMKPFSVGAGQPGGGAGGAGAPAPQEGGQGTEEGAQAGGRRRGDSL
jgi:hypothetical protein